MNIGVDIDGVILDSERAIGFYLDQYAYFELGKEKIRNDSAFIEKNYDLTKEERDGFFRRYFDKITATSPFLPGAREILKRLEEDGHDLYIVTMRGAFNDREIEFCKPRINELGVNFKEILWKLRDKSSACKEYNLDVLIEDNPNHIHKVLGTGIKIIQFKDSPLDIPTVEEPNVFVARCWMDVYRIIEKLSKNSSPAEN